ncbi:hypothetical protein FF1_039310 [Malus domestica]
MDARVAALESSVTALSESIDSKMAISFEQFRREQACARGSGGSTSDTDPPPQPLIADPHDPGDPDPHRPRHNWQPCIDFPRFTPGEDPLAWIYKSEQFFTYYSIPELQNVLTVSFHLEGETLQWFRWHDCLRTTPRWGDFTHAFCKEFGPSEFEDSAEALFKLKQSGTLKDYITEFRRLANRTHDLGPILLKSCFLGGLKRELKYDVKLLRPSDVHDAISIALQLDAKLCDLKSGYTKPFPQPRVLHTPTTPHITPSVKPSNFTVKWLTPAEIQRKREKGECWFCDEKWRTGHNCANKQLLMLDLAYPEEEITTPLLEEPPPEFLQMELSECAFYGTFARTTVKTMKVIGSVNGQQVTVLLDSGSTHNFVDSRLLKKFAWHTQPTKPFEVMIADGGKVISSGCCTDAALSIGGYECGVDLYSLPVGGCDIVLGVKWLSSISPVLWDFQLLTMEFAKNGSQYKLIHSDTHAPPIQEVTLQQLDKEIFNSNLGLFLYSIEDKMIEACDLNPLQLKQLQEVLGQFDTIFVLPTELPPSRVHNHQIPLIPGSKPPNIRLYHYGPLQKTEIEKVVQELLKAGFI